MESTKLVLGSVSYKISPHSIQSRHRSAICSTNCGPSSRESNLSFWLDHQSLFLSPSQPPLVIWTSAGPAKATTPQSLPLSAWKQQGRAIRGSQESPLQCRCCRSAACCDLIHTVFLHNQAGETHTLTHETHLFSTVHQERLEMGKCRSEGKNEIRCMIERHALRHSFQNWERGRGKWSTDQKHQSCYVATPAYASTWSERHDGVCGGYWVVFFMPHAFFFFVFGKYRSLSRAWDSAHMIRILATLRGLWSKSFARSWGG